MTNLYSLLATPVDLEVTISTISRLARTNSTQPSPTIGGVDRLFLPSLHHLYCRRSTIHHCGKRCVVGTVYDVMESEVVRHVVCKHVRVLARRAVVLHRRRRRHCHRRRCCSWCCSCCCRSCPSYPSCRSCPSYPSYRSFGSYSPLLVFANLPSSCSKPDGTYRRFAQVGDSKHQLQHHVFGCVVDVGARLVPALYAGNAFAPTPAHTPAPASTSTFTPIHTQGSTCTARITTTHLPRETSLQCPGHLAFHARGGAQMHLVGLIGGVLELADT